MEHVSTLCALGTIGIAATGLVLGRPERAALSSSVRSRRNTAPRHGQFSPAVSPTTTCFPASTEPALAESNCPAVERDANIPNRFRIGGSRPFKEATPEKGRVRHRRRTYTDEPAKDIGTPISPAKVTTSTGRPSSSWLRRISVISSYVENQSSNSRRPSSAYDPSTPMLTRPSINGRLPNKLVKRSTSQHSIRRPSTASHTSKSMSSILTFRRPVTSRQRSEALDDGATVDGERRPISSAKFPITARDGDLAGGIWRPYFCSVSGETATDPIPWRRSTLGTSKDQVSRRIITDGSFPTLMQPSSLNVRDPTHLQGRRRFASFPGRSQFPDSINTPITGPEYGSFPRSKENRRPRQSLSLGEMSNGATLRPRTASKTGNLRDNYNNPTTFQAKSRNVSNPLPQNPEMSDLRQSFSGAQRLRRKRNFTDSSLLRRPETAPQADSAATHAFQSTALSEILNIPPPRSTGFHRSGADTSRVAIPCRILETTEARALLHKPPNSQPGLVLSQSIIHHPNPKQILATSTDRASVVIRSDDTRAFTPGEEDDTDFQSDSIFDSFRTRATASSHSGRRGPSIDTIFDDFQGLELTKERVPTTDLLTSRDSHLTQALTPLTCFCNSSMDSTSTPALRVTEKHSTQNPSINMLSATRIESFPSDSLEQRDSKAIESNLKPPGFFSPLLATPHERQREDLDIPFRIPAGSKRPPTTSLHCSNIPARETAIARTKTSLFDWSEQSRNDRDLHGSGARPRTVHGKQSSDTRGSRAPGRKAPTALHLRSQSVPVSRDSTPCTESRQCSSKFSTWGLGHKGVSEDWDGDFDFGDSDGTLKDDGKTVAGSGHGGMTVPQAIMERQASVYGQFGQVQELTLLVEELKRLRLQGNLLHIVQGPSSELWKEAEGIINLATVEDEENGFSPPHSPSSRVSFDGFESDSPPSNKTKKRNDEIRRAPLSLWPNPSAITPPRRKDPKTMSVLDTIYQYHDSYGPVSTDSNAYPHQKLPFDTQSLRDLVVRAGVVTRALKEVIRRAEGVTAISRNELPPDPPFSRIFDQPSQDSSALELKN